MRTLTVGLSLLVSLLPACKGADPAPRPEPAPAPAAVTAAPPATASVAPALAPSASASAVPTASAAPVELPKSPRPTPKEWCEGDLATLGYDGYNDGETMGACKMLVVREWAMVWCPLNGQRVGKNLGVYDHAVPGGGSIAKDDELGAGPMGEASDAIVVSLRPGTKAKPTFFYRPSDHPDWIKDESFTLELPADATSLDQRRFNGGAWPKTQKREGLARCAELEAEAKAAVKRAADEKALASAAEDAKGQPDAAGLAPLPADEAFAAEREVLVTGSDALGCKTKVKDDWFWMRCEGKVKLSGIEVERGKRATQTTAVAEGGAVKLTTPYVEETDLRAKLTYEGGERFLKLRWLKGKRPHQVGSIGETR